MTDAWVTEKTMKQWNQLFAGLIIWVLQVNISGLFSSDNNHNLSFGKCIKTVALDPEVKSGVRRFIVG